MQYLLQRDNRKTVGRRTTFIANGVLFTKTRCYLPTRIGTEQTLLQNPLFSYRPRSKFPTSRLIPFFSLYSRKCWRESSQRTKRRNLSNQWRIHRSLARYKKRAGWTGKLGVHFRGEIGKVISGDPQPDKASDKITIFQSLVYLWPDSEY